jgi:hypothetical protein
VNRLEEAILDGDLGAGERVQQRRLADVRVSRERDGGRLRAGPRLPSGGAVCAHVAEPAPKQRDAPVRHASVALQLRLARPAGPDPAAEPLEVLPHAAHAREVVLELCELDLELPLGGDGVLREDVEDQLRPVDDACGKGVL